MEETPGKSTEPSEEELRAMLETREKVQASKQSRLAGIGTRILAISLAVLAIGFFSFRDNREAVASMFREPASDPLPTAQPAKPAGAQESVEDLLLRTSNGVDMNSLGGSSEGTIVTKEDIAFATQLLNFGQTPPPRQEPPPAAKAKDP